MRQFTAPRASSYVGVQAYQPVDGPTVQLSQRDVDLIARVVATEVPPSVARRNPAEYERMVKAVTDTVMNRMASPQFPNTATGVLDQNRQFSKITGPARLDPYGSAEAAPEAPKTLLDMVRNHVVGRAIGVDQSIVDGNVNYANPNFSDAVNLKSWVNPMIDAGAEKFGVGNAVHYHGTAPGYSQADPYNVSVTGLSQVPAPDNIMVDGSLTPADRGILARSTADDMTFRTPIAQGQSIQSAYTETPLLGPSPMARPIEKRSAAPFDVGGIIAPPDMSLIGSAQAAEQPKTDLVMASVTPQDAYQQPAFSTQPPKVDAYGLPPVPGLQPVNPPSPMVAQAPAPSPVPTQVAPQAPAQPAQPTPAQAAPSRLKGIAGKVGGAVLGSAILGPVGGVLGGMLGEKLLAGGQGSRGLLGGLGKAFESGGIPAITGYADPSFFNNPLGFGGTSNASDYVRSGYAPQGIAYRDSAGGTTVSSGNGMSYRTNRFGVTEAMDSQGNTYATSGGGGLLSSLFG